MMMMSVPQPSLSPTQRAFVEAAEALGATAPAAARPLTELPRLSSAELDELVEAGLVREAADWRYYVFRSRRAGARWGVTRAAEPLGAPSAAGAPGPRGWTRSRYLRLLLFWLLAILIPIFFLQFTSRH